MAPEFSVVEEPHSETWDGSSPGESWDLLQLQRSGPHYVRERERDRISVVTRTEDARGEESVHELEITTLLVEELYHWLHETGGDEVGPRHQGDESDSSESDDP